MRILVFIILFLKLGLSSAQDVQFSQFYAAPLYLNPAFTGSTEWTRVGLNFRNQWPGLDHTFVSMSAYVDHFIEHKNSGVGLIVNGTRETFAELQNMEVGALYSYRLKLGEFRFLHVGAQASFVNRYANVEQIILGTQLDIDSGTINADGNNWVTDDSQRSHADINTGLYYYAERIWFGVAAHHLTRPLISYMATTENRLPIRYSAHGGIKIPLKDGRIKEYLNNVRQERSLSFAFNYKRQGAFDQLDFGAELYLQPIIIGTWYRGLPTKNAMPNNEAIVGLLGFSLPNDLDLGYSYDFTISKLGLRHSGGAHEVSLRYTFRNYKLGGKRDRVIPGFKY
ncbi:PorP/SprF family type IX secretion system membrane protein [Pleomorphovibrio marinus]|uniref:PorP/SprF family type IX secretion system membrane protein n=1 Tax=Pleomorphovibrio marinus TaxID=2164132 RepID=UPI000E0C64A4|nr:type IX secretion system membrane protein PorP/SprF [Pleomorphovibrio marinus]